MAIGRSIQEIVAAIRTAIFGKDVREAIADGIEKCYQDATVAVISADYVFNKDLCVPIVTLPPDRYYVNYNYNSNGIAYSSGNDTLVMVDVRKYAVIRLNIPSGYKAMFQVDRGVFYSGENTSKIGNVLSGPFNEDLVVPPGANYIAFSCIKTRSSNISAFPFALNGVRKDIESGLINHFNYYIVDDVVSGNMYSDCGITSSENRLYIGVIKVTKGTKIEISDTSLQHYLYNFKSDFSGSWYTSSDWSNDTETFTIKFDSYIAIIFKKSDNSNISVSDYNSIVKIYPAYEDSHVDDRIDMTQYESTKGLTNINSKFHFENREFGTNWTTGVGILEYYYGDIYNGVLASDPISFENGTTLLIVPKSGYNVQIDEYQYRETQDDYIRSYIYPLFQSENVDFKTDFNNARYINTYPERYYVLHIKAPGAYRYIAPEHINEYANIYKVDNAIHIPKYYEDHLKSKIDTINSHQNGFDKFSFGFITDIHIRHNTKHGIALLREINNQCALSSILGGGDWNTAYNYESMGKAALTQDMLELRNMFGNLPMIKTVGNHEWAYGDFDNPYNITNGELYNIYFRDDEKNAVKNSIVYGSSNGTYFYQDDLTNKVRYISVNVMDYGDDYDVSTYNKEWYFIVSQDQINWLKNTALNLPDDDWCAVLFSHVPPWSGEHTENPIHNYSDLQQLVSNFYNKTDYASNYKGDIICWIAGHTHEDFLLDMVSNETKLVVSNADCFLKFGDAPTRTKYTTSEQSFDIFTVDKNTRTVYITRIGAGSDRSFTY